MEKQPTHGDIGWVCLTAGIIAWDLLAPETLSGAYDRYLEHPVKRVLAIGAVAVTGAHLLNLLPKAIDPFYQAGEIANRFLHGQE